MKRVAVAVLLLALIGVAACGQREPAQHGGRHVDTLDDALSVEHDGVTLRDLLGRTNKSFRGTGDAVLAAYAELGNDAPAWLAKAVESGIPQDPDHGLRVLEVSREIAREAIPTLERWLRDRSSEGGEFRVRVASLLLEVDADHPEAQSGFREALRSNDSEVFTRAMLSLGLLGTVGMQFAKHLLDAAEAPRGRSWAPNIVRYLDQHGPVSEDLGEQLGRVREEANRTYDDPSDVIDTGR